MQRDARQKSPADAAGLFCPLICHSGLDPESILMWIPACAGMTLGEDVQ